MQRGNYASYEGYGERSSYGKQQRQQGGYQQRSQAPSPWQPNTQQSNQQLSNLDVELEMVKRKRQMLQEQRQLLEAQQQLERLQGQRTTNPWNNSQNNRQFVSQPQPRYNQNSYASLYERAGEKRALKRPAKATPWDQAPPKRFAPSAAPFAPYKPRYAEAPLQAARDVGPAQPPPQVYLGDQHANRSVRNKLNTAVNSILREMRDMYFAAPHNITLPQHQYYAMKQRVLMRVQKMMMNKLVGSPAAIHEMYRQTHTAKGDMRLVQSVQALTVEMCKKKPPVPGVAKPAPAAKAKDPVAKTVVNEDEEKANDFIRDNFEKALEKNLTLIFDKIHEIFAEDVKSETADEKIVLKTEPAALETTEGVKPDRSDEVAADKAVVAEESNVTAEKTDATDTTEKTDAAENTDAAMKDSEAPEKAEAAVKPEADGLTPKDIEMKDLSSLEAWFDSRLDYALKRKLPQVLPRYKNYVMSIIARDPIFKDLGIKPERDVMPTPQPSLKPLCFVKILGKPMLPARTIMKKFLLQFEPGSIKKHKTVFNLLYVGVPEQHYQSLLSQNKCLVGGKQLDIRLAPNNKDVQTSKDDSSKAKSDGEIKVEKTNGDINGGANSSEAKEVEVAIAENTEAMAEKAYTDANGESEQKEALTEAMNDLDTEINDLLTSIQEADTDDAGVTAGADDLEGKKDVEGKEENIEGNNQIVENKEEVLAGEEKNCESEKDEEHNSSVEKETPATPASNIRTRRSSRLPQKN